MKEYKNIYFDSKDGLQITADFYEISNPKGFILFCHRSHCNRAEYRETAPKLNNLGYSCLAIGQRSGMKAFGEVNETKNRAKGKGLSTGYLDAKADIEAAIDHSFMLNSQKPIVLFGSSYSASLALLISLKRDKVRATIAFSPAFGVIVPVWVASVRASLHGPFRLSPTSRAAFSEVPSLRRFLILVRGRLHCFQ